MKNDFKELINQINDNLLINNSWYLYVLLLENNYYYVGITLYPQNRILLHFKRLGSNFTKKNLPIKLLELNNLNIYDRKLAYKEENLKTKELRKIYGCDKVIGGKYLRLKKIK